MLTEALITQVCKSRGSTPRDDYVKAFSSPEAAEIFAEYGISADPRIMAAFLANICHETGGMRLVRENANYSAKNLHRVWPMWYGVGKKGRDGKVNRDSDGDGLSDLAEAHGKDAIKALSYNYGGRMGNRPGTTDGYDFRGAGPLQCTGREMFLWLERETGLPFASEPKTIEKPEHWALVAALTWCKRGANLCTYAEQGNFLACCKQINTGSVGSKIAVVGMDDREAWYRAWTKALGAAKPSASGVIVYKVGAPNSEAVKAIQKRLNALMYGEGKLTEDGNFGVRTRSAVMDFQVENGLNADGEVGPKTWEVLFDAAAKCWPAPAAAVAGVAGLRAAGDPEIKKAENDRAAGWSLGSLAGLQLANVSGLLDSVSDASKQASGAQSAVVTLIDVLKFASNNLLPILCLIAAGMMLRRYGAVVYERVERWTRPVGDKEEAA